jgi:phosphatidylserine decarboxylase
MADRASGIPIVREGVPFIVVGGALTALAVSLGWIVVASILGVATLFTAWFFRNPRRTCPDRPGTVVAPGDGRVVAIDQEFEPRYLKEGSIRISIFLNVFNVHVNRIPCEGVVEDIAYRPGQFLAANRSEATLRNEQNAVMIRTPHGNKVMCVQVAGLIARRIVCWVSPGESVTCGERFGLIRFGSRMDTFLPSNTKVSVAVGDSVKGGQTILGELVRPDLPGMEASCAQLS